MTTKICLLVITIFTCACYSSTPDTRELSAGSDSVPLVRGREGRRTSDGSILADTFDLNHTLRGDTLMLQLTTDLPDQTALMVSVSRTFQTREDDETYVVDYFSDGTTVGQWRVPHTIVLDDREWKRTLDDRRRVLSVSGEPFTVKSVNPDIKVSLTVPMIQDPPFARWNANLRGRVVSADQEGRRLVQRELIIRRPLETSDLSQTKWGDPNNLRRGKTYRLSKVTPLVPEPKPRDPLAAIAAIRQLEASSTVRVLSVVDNDGPWYRVRVMSGPEAGSEGWINSIALLSQELVESSQ
jgi:hypothetical protein